MTIGKAFYLLDLMETPQSSLLQNEFVQYLQLSFEELESGDISITPLSQLSLLHRHLLEASVALKPENEYQRYLRDELLTRLKQISDLRLKRLTVAWGNASPGFWAFLTIGFAAIAFCFGAYTPNVRRHCYMGVFFAFVGLTSFFIYELSSPYSGPIKVSGKAYMVVREAMLSILAR